MILIVSTYFLSICLQTSNESTKPNLVLNPLVMEDTMVWGGLYQEGVASKEDCETFCLDNICEVANYVASNQLCFTATDAKSNHFFGL